MQPVLKPYHPNTPPHLCISELKEVVSMFILSITDRCNIKCDFCCHPYMDTYISDADALSLTRQASLLDFDEIGLTGGEPFLKFPLMLELAAIVKASGKRFGANTNAFWARTRAKAEDYLFQLRDAGLTDIVVSWDPSHGTFVPASAARNAIEVASELGIFVCLTGSFKDPADTHAHYGFELEHLRRYQNFSQNVNPVAAVGNGVDLGIAPVQRSIDFEKTDCRCPSRNLKQIVVYANDGLTQPCCSIFAGYKMKEMSLGDWRSTPVSDLHIRHQGDPFFTIACEGGFRRVYEIAQEAAPEVFERLPDPASASSACDLCAKIMTSPVAGALRSTLATHLLERVALQ